MKKLIKRGVTIIMMVCILCTLGTSSLVLANDELDLDEYDMPKPTSQFYVNDFADVFTGEQEYELVNNAAKLAEDADGTQVVITTISKIPNRRGEDEEIEDNAFYFATEMYNKYKIGKDAKGILLVYSVEDSIIADILGDGLFYMSSADLDDFVFAYASDFRNKKFAEGLIKVQTDIIADIYKNIDKVAPEKNATPVEEKEVSKKEESTIQEEQKEKSSMASFSILVALIALIGLVVAVAYYRKTINKMRKEADEKDKKCKRKIENVTNALESTVNDLKRDLNVSEANYNSLLDKYNKLEERHRRSLILYPSLNDEIDHQIEEEIKQKNIAVVNNVRRKINDALEYKVTRENLDIFSEAVKSYNNLTPEQLEFCKDVDIQLLKRAEKEAKVLENRRTKNGKKSFISHRSWLRNSNDCFGIFFFLHK